MSLTITKAPAGNKEIIVNELNIRTVDRSRKDIGTWRRSLISAESVYYPNRSACTMCTKMCCSMPICPVSLASA